MEAILGFKNRDRAQKVNERLIELGEIPSVDIVNYPIIVDVQEIKRPDLDAQLVAENVAMQLEKRIAFRRAMKKVVQSAMSFGAGGIRVRCSGRLGGAEIARTEEQKDGCVPLHTIRAGVEYGFAEANTSAGKIGIKCWLLKSKDDFLVAKKR